MLKPFEVYDNHQLPSEMEGPILKWNAENGVAMPIDMQFEFYDNLAEQPQEALDALLETPRPCKLLNPKLRPWLLGPLNQACYIVNIEHEGEPRLAVIFGFHKQARDAFVKQPDREAWNALSTDDAPPELPLENLDTPPKPPRYYQLLQPQLTAKQIREHHDAFDIVNIEHEGAPRLATLWGFYRQERDAFVKAEIYEMTIKITEEKEE